MRAFRKREKGALAIDAIIGITMFLLTIIAIMFFSVIVRVQANMQYALGQAAKEMSGYFYFVDKMGFADNLSGFSEDSNARAMEVNEKIGYIVDFAGTSKDSVNELKNVINSSDYSIYEKIEQAGSSVSALESAAKELEDKFKDYNKDNALEHIKVVLQVFGTTLKNRFFGKYIGGFACKMLVPKYLTAGDIVEYYQNMGFVEYEDGKYVDFGDSELLADGRSITLVAKYELDLSQLTFGMVNTTMKFKQVASTAAWVKPDGNRILPVNQLFGQTKTPTTMYVATTTTASVDKAATPPATPGDGDTTKSPEEGGSETPKDGGTETPKDGDAKTPDVKPEVHFVDPDDKTTTTVAVVDDSSVKPEVTTSIDKVPAAFAEYTFYSTDTERKNQTPGPKNKFVEWEGGIDNRGNGICILHPDGPKKDKSTAKDRKNQEKYNEVQQILKDHHIEGIEYKNYVPDFSPVMNMEFDHIDMSHGRNGDTGTYMQANRQLCNILNSVDDREKAKEYLAKLPGIEEGHENGEPYETDDIMSYMSEHGWTWHEVNDCETIQMVPTVINSTFGHLGGISEAKKKGQQESSENGD